MASFYRTQLENWIKSIDLTDSGNVLDVGGADKPMMKRGEKFGCDKYVVVDIKETEFPTIILDMNAPVKMSEELQAEFKGFDTVFCFELMEYIFDPVTCTKNLFRLTKPGGVLYISFPRVYPDHNPLDIDYLRYTKRGCIKLLEVAGFENIEVVKVRKIAAPSSILKAYRADGMHVGTEETVDDTGYILKAMRPEATSRTQVSSDNINRESHRHEPEGSGHEAPQSVGGGLPEPVRDVTL